MQGFGMDINIVCQLRKPASRSDNISEQNQSCLFITINEFTQSIIKQSFEEHWIVAELLYLSFVMINEPHGTATSFN